VMVAPQTSPGAGLERLNAQVPARFLQCPKF
jgi:hypothetical protein